MPLRTTTGAEEFRARLVRPDGRVRRIDIASQGPGDETLSGQINLSGGIDHLTAFPATGLCDVSVNIDVRDRDERKLRTLCATLYEATLSATNTNTSVELQAAETLSRIKDSAAVPYLSALMSTRERLANLAVRGLERITDSAAVDALIAHASDQETDTRELVKASLKRIGESTDDPAVKSKISAEANRSEPAR